MGSLHCLHLSKCYVRQSKHFISKNFQERDQLVLYSINAKVVPLALRSLSPPGSAAFSCIKLHLLPVVIPVPDSLSHPIPRGNCRLYMFSTLQAIPKLPSHKVNMVALWGNYLKFATLRSNEVEKLMEGEEVMAICESALQWMSSSTALQCVPVQCAERFEMWWEHCRAEQSRAGQGKEEDDRASDTFPFHRQQGRGKKIGHCLKQMGKKRQYICIHI